MPFVVFDEVDKEFVTPKYSTAFGELVTGEHIEVGRLTFKQGEGAVEHAHPQPIVIEFDRGDGGKTARKMLFSGTYVIGIDPEKQCLDLFDPALLPSTTSPSPAGPARTLGCPGKIGG